MVPVPLTDNNKTELRKLFKRLVRQIRPEDLTGTASTDGRFIYFADSEENKRPSDRATNYAKALRLYMRDHPHLISGEKFSDGTRMSFDPAVFDQSDVSWILSTIQSCALEIRCGEGRDFKSRIVKEPKAGWVNWETTDCCFAAVLHALDIPGMLTSLGVDGRYVAGYPQGIKNKSADVASQLGSMSSLLALYANTTDSIKQERMLEEMLAGFTQIPRRAVPDDTLIYLFECRLNWSRVACKTLSDLNSKAQTNNSYIVSYCADKTIDFRHIVHALRAANQ